MYHTFNYPSIRDPRPFYWVIESDRSRAWSITDNQYVDQWLADLEQLAPSEQDLADFLHIYGLPGPVPPSPTEKDRLEAMELIIDLGLMEGE